MWQPMAWHDRTRRAIPNPSPDEFSGWSPPSHLISHLQGGKAQPLIDGLLSRLENGFLFAAAGIWSWRDKALRLQKRYEPISIEPDWWQAASGVRNYWDTLWTLGDGVFRLYDHGEGEFVDVAFTAIRFEASGLYNDALIPRPAGSVEAIQAQATAAPVLLALEAPATGQTPRPKVARANLGSWCAQFGNDNPDAPFGAFLNAARNVFPNRHVSERAVKDEMSKLGLTKSRGNPAFRR